MVVRRHLEGKRGSKEPVLCGIPSLPRDQRGVFAPMSAVFLTLIFTVCAMALGLSQLYNRKIELQSFANSVALAAARELDGTDAGLAVALQKAATIAAKFHYNYHQPIAWSDNAISFSNSPEGGWVSAGGGGAQDLFYVKVNTENLANSTGEVSPLFGQFLLSDKSTVQINATAVAGRAGIKAVPLAVCALEPTAAANRASELVEYGFRRGIPYDLMNLNPGGTTRENFVIDPIVAPGAPASTHHTADSFVGPFVCTGKMWMPRVLGGDIQVSRPFPLNPLYKQLNSRFDQYPDQLCSPNGAPPDLNVKSFTGTWMKPAQSKVQAEPYLADGKLRTVADPLFSSLSIPPGKTKTMWGALWSYSKAVKYSSYHAGKSEPQPPLSGYATFSPIPTDFASLYQAGLSTSSYPTDTEGGTPYKASITSPPSHPKVAEENRRVLNVPLLSCPVPAGANVKAQVLAVGKFFMTQPASPTSIVAEFAGIVPPQVLVDQVELFK